MAEEAAAVAQEFISGKINSLWDGWRRGEGGRREGGRELTDLPPPLLSSRQVSITFLPRSLIY